MRWVGFEPTLYRCTSSSYHYSFHYQQLRWISTPSSIKEHVSFQRVSCCLWSGLCLNHIEILQVIMPGRVLSLGELLFTPDRECRINIIFQLRFLPFRISATLLDSVSLLSFDSLYTLSKQTIPVPLCL